MKKLYRSRRDSKLFGLCGGLAEMLEIDSTLLRLVVVVAAFFSGGAVIPLYFIACLVIPREPLFHDPFAGAYGYRNPGGYQSYGNSGGHMNQGGSYHHPNGPAYNGGVNGPAFPGGYSGGASKSQSNLDEMMNDIEKKALRKEIEELRSKLAQYEKQNNHSKGDE